MNNLHRMLEQINEILPFQSYFGVDPFCLRYTKRNLEEGEKMRI